MQAGDYGCLALDFGGVICADPWETIFTARGGLCDRYGIPREEAMEKGNVIWHLFAYADHDEEEFWNEWEETLGLHLDRALIAELARKAIWFDTTAAGVVRQCLSDGKTVAIVSNSTSFWFPMQMERSGLAPMADKIKMYLSHELGYCKTDGKGGLKRLAADMGEKKTFFIDDRKGNVEAARALGFGAAVYAREEGRNLDDFLRLCQP